MPAVVHASAGNGFSVFVTTSGTVFACGKVKDGRSGLSQDSAVPHPVVNLTGIRYVACGYWHTIAIDRDGRLFATGHNKHGELGLGDTQDRPAFTLVETCLITQASCGQHATLLISQETGKALSSGKAGVSGLPRDANAFSELRIEERVRSVSCGTVHTACVTETGRVYTWGIGTFGQLGHGNHTTYDEPKEVEGLRGVDVVQVSCSKGEKYGHTACIDSGRNLYLWGSGYKGKLGLDAHWSHEDPADRLVPTLMDGFKADYVECGGIHTAAISENQLFTWGCGSDGRIGHPECEGHRYLYKEPVPRLVANLPEVRSLSCSYYHNVVVARGP